MCPGHRRKAHRHRTDRAGQSLQSLAALDCERPQRTGPACRAAWRVAGVAAGAALGLIGTLAEAGRTVHARADFDRVGLGIVDRLRAVVPAYARGASTSPPTAPPMASRPLRTWRRRPPRMPS
ncbi:hypothetical protein DPM19_09675 [Actinomadura craniellae]|uniref:DUF2399 domain-containing protein n=1 Tax=Actinomadura craniellae TaxID=2231787 RepID=A0A365H7B9_9ACTN|nr:hypothetical protein DPM19_09675 [Actinomadura craniellae]